MTENSLSNSIIGAAISVHRELGPGLLESTYEVCLCRELELRGIGTLRQVPVRISYKGLVLEERLRADILVERIVLVEVKAVDKTLPVHKAQLLTYLRLTGQPVGLLSNFGGATVKEGVRRVVNDYHPSASPRLRVNQIPR